VKLKRWRTETNKVKKNWN